MSKWRPSKQCLYVIPDIHGQAYCLKQILKRITPLRDNDVIVFLGDYIDRGKESKEVLDQLLELKNKFKDQVRLLMGNHEWLMLASAGRIKYNQDPKNPSPCSVWMANGGYDCIMSYDKNLRIEQVTQMFKEKLVSYVPKEHLDFLEKHLELYCETDEYIFVHAGCDPMKPLDEQSPDDMLWNNSLYKFAKFNLGKKMPWEKTVICGHSHVGPFIADKFMMLDAGQHKKLLVVELNSMEAFYSEPGTTRMVEANLQETKPKIGLIKRIG